MKKKDSEVAPAQKWVVSSERIAQNKKRNAMSEATKQAGGKKMRTPRGTARRLRRHPQETA